MIFSSLVFLFCFLPAVLLLHTLVYVHRKHISLVLPNALLFAASIFFYAWGEPQHVIIILCSSLVNFHTALFLEKTANKNSRKFFLLLGICINLGLLAYFKYGKFLHDSLTLMAIPLSQEWNFLRNIALPLGISFYTFQGMSYIIDVYRKESPASRSYINFACYLCLFPQLVAGPIVRYTTIAAELTRRVLTVENLSIGVQRFITGLAKKVLLADTFGRVADAAFQLPAGELPAAAAWLGIICYTLQIYYDFSGYSDMAIGMGRMLGFTFPENFNYPYVARSMREFWQRWHMTLSLWFRDYLYIPLGGNRCATWRVACNLLIVFALCGLWHGATFGFLAWGIFHGLFLGLERLFPRVIARLPRVLQHAYLLFTVMMGWVIFRTEHLVHAKNYFAALCGLHTPKTLAVNSVWLAAYGYALPLALALGICFAVPLYPWIRQRLNTLTSHGGMLPVFTDAARTVLLLALLLLCFLPIFGATYTSFIYFRF